jgi:2-haloacid dehalogenase
VKLPAALAFDLYGTLVDYTSLRHLVYPVSQTPSAFIDVWRQKQLQYALLVTLMERYVDFEMLTGLALDFAAAQFHAELDAPTRAGLIDAWSHLPPHPDVPKALAALRASGVRMAVLSNGTPQALARTVQAAGLEEYFDGLLSVESVRRYKPHPSVYNLAVDFFGLPAGEIGFVSSNGWDAAGAVEFGFRVFWCNRGNAPAETLSPAPELVVNKLGGLLEI